jgi:hypothetical protein
VRAASVNLLNAKDPLSDPVAVARLKELVRRRTAAGERVVVFVDTYGSSVSGVDHISSEYADPLKHLLRELTGPGAGAAVVPLLHARKGLKVGEVPGLDDAEGSVGIMGAIDGAIGIHAPNPEDSFTVKLTCVRPVRNGFAPLEMRWVDIEAPEGHEPDPQWALRAVDPDPAEFGEAPPPKALSGAKLDGHVYEGLQALLTRWHMLPGGGEGLTQGTIHGMLRLDNGPGHASLTKALKRTVEAGKLRRGLGGINGRTPVFRPYLATDPEVRTEEFIRGYTQVQPGWSVGQN